MDRPFFSTIGLELTWLPPNKRNRRLEDCLAHGSASFLEAAFICRKIGYFSIGTDEGAVEVSTVPFSNLLQIKKFYEVLIPEVWRFDLVTHREDTVSGGGHIHVGIPWRIKRDKILLLRFLTNVFRDVTNRPYLNWIFNEWANEESAKNIVEYKNRFRGTYPGGSRDPSVWEQSPLLRQVFFNTSPSPSTLIPRLPIKDIFDLFGLRKGYALRGSPPYMGIRFPKPFTLELRFFDTKRNFREIELHVDFVNAYLSHIEKISREGKIVYTEVQTEEDIQRLTKKDLGLKKFRLFMKELGLNHADYEYFVDLNYRRRKKEGLLR